MSAGDGNGFDTKQIENGVGQVGNTIGQWVDKARQEVNKQVQNGNLQSAGEKLVNSGALNLVAPQLGVLFGGANLVGGQVEKRQINDLVSHPKELGQQMLSAFDSLDKNKNHFVDNKELYSNGSFTRVLDGNNAVSRVMAAGYTTMAGLDGNDPAKGITKRDIEIFGHMQDPKALKDDIEHEGHMSGLKWGVGAAIVGGAASMFIPGMRSWGSRALAAGAAGLVGGIIADHHTESSLESFYATKKTESDRMLSALRKDTELSAGNILNDAKKNLLPGFLKKIF